MTVQDRINKATRGSNRDRLLAIAAKLGQQDLALAFWAYDNSFHFEGYVDGRICDGEFIVDKRTGAVHCVSCKGVQWETLRGLIG